MKQEGLKYFTSLELTGFAFFLFLLTFIGIVIWTYRRSGKKEYDEIAQAPLREEATNGQN